MDWTYHVKISTEAGSGITNAVQELSTTQQKASEKFSDVVEFLNGEAFTEIILNTLLEHLEKQNKEEDDKKIEDHLTSIIESIQQVQAGIITLMNLKEGNFSNVLDSFRIASESLDKKGIENSIIKMFRKDFGKNFKGQLMKNITDVFHGLPTTLSSVDDDELDSYINEQSELTNKFLEKPSKVTFEDVLTDVIPNIMYSEFQEFFNKLGDSGKEIFNKILEWEGNQMKDAKGHTALYFIKKAMKDYLKPKYQYKGTDPTKLTKETIPRTEKFEFKTQGHWDDLKEAFKEGIFKNLINDKDSILKDPAVFSVAESFVDNFFDEGQKKILRAMNMPKRRNIPDVEGKVYDAATNPQSFDNENLQNVLKQYMAKEKGSSIVESFKNKFNDIFKKSQLEANTGENPKVDLQGILKKNLEEAGEGFEEIAKPIADATLRLLSEDKDKGGNKVWEELEKMLLGKKSDVKDISILEKLNSSLKEVKDTIEETTSEFRKNKDGTVTNFADLDFDGFFAESLKNQELISDTIMFTKQTIVNTINNTATQLDAKISQAIGMIGNLKSVRNRSPPATSTGLSSLIGEE